MKKPLKIFISFIGVVVLLIVIAPFAFYYLTGVNYFAIAKTYNKSEIKENAKVYSTEQPLLIKKEFFEEYGKGHFPKYKIYNQDKARVNTYACYESLPELPEIIKKDRSRIIEGDAFETEIAKARLINGTPLANIFVPNKYNMIFYYKNAMNRIQQKQLNNILTGNLGDFKDSLHVIYVNVDLTDF